MRREQLEHLLRAASSIAGVTDLVVIGSHAILGTYPEWELPREATMSVEADLAVDAELARLEFCGALARSELVDRDTCLERIAALPELDRRKAQAVASAAF